MVALRLIGLFFWCFAQQAIGDYWNTAVMQQNGHKKLLWLSDLGRFSGSQAGFFGLRRHKYFLCTAQKSGCEPATYRQECTGRSGARVHDSMVNGHAARGTPNDENLRDMPASLIRRCAPPSPRGRRAPGRCRFATFTLRAFLIFRRFIHDLLRFGKTSG
jgi:hypothetical protein